MDKMTHTKFNLNTFLMAISSSFDNIVPNNQYNIKYNSKRVAYIALKLATLENLSPDKLCDIFSYSIVYQLDLDKTKLNNFPFQDRSIIEDKTINNILKLALGIEKNLDIKDNIIVNKDQIVSIFHTDENLTILFDELSFWYDLISTCQLPFYIFNFLQDFTSELEFNRLILFTNEIHNIVCNYASRKYTQSIGSRCEKICDFYGFDNKDKSRMIIGSHLLNIGLLHIPKSILNKNDKLSQNEFDIMKSVPYHTDTVLKQIFGFGDIAQLSSSCYERLDGSGYPYKIKANNLSLKNRILAILTVYQALSENRSYRDLYNKIEIIKILKDDIKDGRLDITVIEPIVDILDDE